MGNFSWLWPLAKRSKKLEKFGAMLKNNVTLYKLATYGNSVSSGFTLCKHQ